MRKQRFFSKFLLWAVFSASMPVRAETGFDEIWSAILSNAPGLKSERLEKQATETQLTRTKSHWAPSLVATAGVVSTNSPSTSLFSQLGARSLQASDLSPSVMNDPSRAWFKQAQLTLVFPVYEGGASTAAAQGAAMMDESQSLRVQAEKTELYAGVVRDYTVWSSLEAEIRSIQGLRSKLTAILERYRLASKDNPVGYSGWLGMKSLQNRLDSIVASARIEMNAIEARLREQSGMEALTVEGLRQGDAVEFSDRRLRGLNEFAGTSARVEAFRAAARGQERYATAEKSKWLPQMGVYASGNLNQSPRDTGTSTEFGAYLRWSLFDAKQIGAYREASMRAQAISARSEEAAQNSRAARVALEKAIPELRNNLVRIRESGRLLQEQTLVTERLFRTGAVNALQLSEVLSRHADVIDQERQLVVELVGQTSQLFVQNGGFHE